MNNPVSVTISGATVLVDQADMAMVQRHSWFTSEVDAAAAYDRAARAVFGSFAKTNFSAA